MENNDFDFALPCLSPGEYILHRCQPGGGHLLTARDVFMIPFSIFWCGFAFFWEIGVILSGAPFFFCLFGLPFICIGLYLVFGRFIWTAYIRKRTAYVITNRKVIRRRGKRIDMLDGRNMPPMQVVCFQDGNGTITFGQQVYRRTHFNVVYSNEPFTLENIPEVVKVQQTISGMEK